MQNRRNYYRILHVQPDAPFELIKSSYRTLLQKLKKHPDLGGDHWNASLINEAYEVLSDPKRRAEYNERIAAEIRGYQFLSRSSENSDKHATPQSEKRCIFCKGPLSDEATKTCSICNSPASLTLPDSQDKDCKRTLQRIQKDGVILYYPNWQEMPVKAYLCDVSPRGLSFYSMCKAPKGQIIKIECELLDAIALVKHSESLKGEETYDFQTGVKFLTASFRKKKGNFFSIRI